MGADNRDSSIGIRTDHHLDNTITFKDQSSGVGVRLRRYKVARYLIGIGDDDLDELGVEQTGHSSVFGVEGDLVAAGIGYWGNPVKDTGAVILVVKGRRTRQRARREKGEITIRIGSGNREGQASQFTTVIINYRIQYRFLVTGFKHGNIN